MGQALHLYGPGEPAGFIGATLGAILVLWVYRIAMRRRITA
ncbi:MAG TPA: GlsB/YeaQ/YmgE family stress response membrane protein [Thermoanaerobaculia bacterium]|nr:GlsB/YeaQ/YmgE family stress response membrane protein [Thermoanaerobaculia bacterium]